MAQFTPGKSAFSRVFLIENRARPDHAPEYQSCIKAGAVDWSFGDVTRIECPSPERYGEFDEIGEIQAAVDRPTTQLTGKYPADLASDLLRLARLRCDNDVHVNFGACTDPRVFTAFTKKVIWEKTRITNYSTDDLGALSSDENAQINEMADLSANVVYEVLPLNLAERGAATVTNAIIDGVICDTAGCGDCDDPSDGCERIYFITLASGGSPGTAADVIYSLDKGATWTADEVTTLDASEDPTGIACLGAYVVVISSASDSLHYKTKSVLDAGTAANWTEIATGIVAAGSPNDIWSVGNYAFICGDGGYVYGTADPTVGVTVLDAGVATTNDLNAVHALNDQFAVAVGDSDTIIFTVDRINWDTATATGGGNNLNCVWVKNEDEWFVGDASGNLYYTTDRGTTWTAIGFPGTAAGSIWDLQFSTDSVAYMVHVTAGNAGRVLRTYDGGHEWVILPEGVGSIPTNAGLYLAVCKHDANFFAAGGYNTAVPTDGVIIVGED